MGLRSTIAHSTGFSNGRDWNPDHDLADLSGKVAIVTGGNAGLGEETVRALHAKGCKVYLAARSEEKANDAIGRINATTPGKEAGLVFLPFDLTDLKSIKRAAETVKEKEERLDIVVCNAGVMAWPYKIINGVEVQFWNHLGHFALIHHLLPLLKKTAQSSGPTSVRIVNVSSLGHTFAPKNPDFSSIEGVNQEYGSTWTRYGLSKLTNVLFSVGLNERIQGDNIKVNSCHPGNVATTLTRGPQETYGFLARWLSVTEKYMLMTPTEGAKTQIYLAASPEVDEKGYSGKYFTPIATEVQPSAQAQDKSLAEALWKLSENFVNEHDV
ncbi:SDR family oxidoreductase [Sporobolomyces salmoneus]|uniref:SDR family oxidoreductase n=1 Tax=Sporobolomyces salmoneus TaxID=183962 RepID=UPI00317B3599